ncbi:MAG TPA: M20 aminoacylase family protein, partial [Fusobacterium sp.]|uniref:M20 aminoacylase family protein n=1 Tax=Fusobacterium sp. TaxID=68766 RepID=UPI002F3FE644
KTSQFVAEKLEEMGYEIHRNIGKTGIVANLTVGDSKKAIGLRADMDCIPVQEVSNLEYKSQHDGCMHACGHDGHVVTLLGAAYLLSKNRNFKGTVRLIFQPAEEPGYGASAMMKDGLFEKFPIEEIYGLHNMPGLAEGTIHARIGGIMASEDNFTIKIHGKGGHASAPNLTIDPLAIAANIIISLQTIVSRNSDPIDTAVISCTEILTDGAHNVIPSNVTILGDTRSFNPKVQELIEKRMKDITENICKAYGADWEFFYTHEFSPTINTENCYNIAVQAAKNALGEENVVENCQPLMSSEDFAKYLEKVPGCFVFLGGAKEGEEIYSLHHHCYDYNDRNLLKGAKYFEEIVKISLS